MSYDESPERSKITMCARLAAFTQVSGRSWRIVLNGGVDGLRQLQEKRKIAINATKTSAEKIEKGKMQSDSTQNDNQRCDCQLSLSDEVQANECCFVCLDPL